MTFKKNIGFILLLLILVGYRFYYFQFSNTNICSSLTWDCLGYYMYLPSAFIYHNLFHFTWLPSIFQTYHLPGEIYQYRNLPNGNMVGYYQIGVAILQMPFFFLAHICAKYLHFPTDGFSKPYQLFIAFSGIVYASIGLYLIKNVLQKYFDYTIVLLTLLILVIGTNFLQYTAVEGSQVHAYGFFTMALVLFFTQKLHENFTSKNIFFVAFCVGLAIVVRPTDGVVFFVPLLWLYPKLPTWQSKWTYLKANPSICLLIIGSVLLACLPQLIYWKTVSGDWLHPAGSSWRFLWPWFRVLIGGQKGWFIYTPLTLLFVFGFYFSKNKPWHKAILTFFILNIWIVIAWNTWKYGASYSCRALVQGMVIGSLPMASAIAYFVKSRYKNIFYVLVIYFIANNLFQTYQYNAGIMVGEENSWQYYKAIYWQTKKPDQWEDLIPK